MLLLSKTRFYSRKWKMSRTGMECYRDFTTETQRSLSWKNGRVEGWKNSTMEEWKNGRMEKFDNSTIRQWKSGKMEKWKNGIVENRKESHSVA